MRPKQKFFMEHISTSLKNKQLTNNVSNVSKNNSNNDTNVALQKTNQYALNTTSFIPNTPETKLAEDIAISFNDLQNYAFYLHVVKKLEHSTAYTFWRSIQEEIKQKFGSKYEIINPKKYFAWKFKKGLR